MRKKRKNFFFLRIMKRAGFIGRLFIAVIICACVISFTIRSENRKVVTYDYKAETTAESNDESDTTEDEADENSTDYLTEDDTFEECYVMISNAGNDGRPATKIPGDNSDVVSKLSNGTIVWAEKKGTYKGNSYYRLEDGSYLLDEDEYVLELKSYTRLAGYVNITLVSATGVKMRAWANFTDDNVIKSAFVGDQIKIVGKVVTKYGDEAYRTEEGLYMTTNSEYYEDHTAEVDSYNGAADQEQEDSFE